VDKVTIFEDIKLIPDTIGEAGLEKDLSIAPEVIGLILNNEDLEIEEPFHIHYVVVREKDSEKFHARIDIAGEVKTFCSRCLNPMTHQVKLTLDTQYLPALPGMSDHLEEERVSSEIGYYKKSIFLGEYIVSELVLSFPIRYICSPDCKGLCPGCGADLNNAPCTCEKPIDPRLQKLAVLKEKIRR
jgi:uncharacterized metal-binding protein YceD (DUF177 family)